MRHDPERAPSAITGEGLENVLHGDDFAALVEAALRADPMRHLRLVALRAGRQRLHLEEVMGTPSTRALFGMASFWIWHRELPKRLFSWLTLRESPAALPSERRKPTHRSCS